MKKTLVCKTRVDLNTIISWIETSSCVGFDTESYVPVVQVGRSKTLNVRDSELVGVSVACLVDGQFRSAYIPHQANWVHAVLHPLFRDARKVWAHNWKWDLQALMTLGPITALPHPTGSLDSMVAAWLLCEPEIGLKALAAKCLGATTKSFEEVVGQDIRTMTPEDLAEYAGNDALWTLQLGLQFEERLKAWNLWKWFGDVECPFTHVLAQMEFRGMRVDIPGLEALYATVGRASGAVLSEWEFLFPGVNPKSQKQLNETFYDTGLWPVEGVPAGKNGLYSTKAEYIDAILEHLDPESVGAEGARLQRQLQAYAKYLSTYTHTLAEAAARYSDRCLHPNFNGCGTVTGRLSCSNPNLQNVPAHAELSKALKACFIPQPGNLFVAADYSQIELRVLAHYSGGALAAAYREGRDLHQQTADMVGISRQQAKTLNFALIYGAGPAKLGKQMGVSYGEARAYVERYKKAYPGVVTFKDAAVRAARERGYIRTLAGRRRYIPELAERSEDAWRGERLAVNTPVQGSAADIVKKAMVDLYMQHFLFPVSQVHDEITLDVPTDVAQDTSALLKSVMESAWDLKVPLVAEPKVGGTWAETK